MAEAENAEQGKLTKFQYLIIQLFIL